jgi:hypothetical protein
MALTLLQKHQLINSAPFNGRVEAGAVKLAVYRQNANPDAWSKDLLEDANYRLGVVNTLRWYVLENVAANAELTAGGDDSTATDAAIQGEIDAQVTRIYGA